MNRMVTARESRHLAARRFDEEMAVIDLRERTLHTMNAAGALLWELIRSGTTLEDLARSLCERFSVEPECAERDVAAFVESLERAGLVLVH